MTSTRNINPQGTLLDLRSDQRGIVYVEFLMVFFPMLLLFLGGVQLALIQAAKLVVGDAALRGVRAAIVILDDDPKRYDNAPRGSLNEASNSADSLSHYAEKTLGISIGKVEAGAGGARLKAIRSASYVPLSVLAPSLLATQQIFAKTELGFGNAIENSYAARFGLGYGLFNRAAAAVTVTAQPSSNPVAPDSVISVRVTYLYYCGMPLVAKLLCKQALYFKKQLQKAETPTLFHALLLSPARFALLDAEATLPNQGARHHGAYEKP